jgi:hypothetical protein
MSGWVARESAGGEEDGGGGRDVSLERLAGELRINAEI